MAGFLIVIGERLVRAAMLRTQLECALQPMQAVPLLAVAQIQDSQLAVQVGIVGALIHRLGHDFTQPLQVGGKAFRCHQLLFGFLLLALQAQALVKPVMGAAVGRVDGQRAPQPGFGLGGLIEFQCQPASFHEGNGMADARLVQAHNIEVPLRDDQSMLASTHLCAV